MSALLALFSICVRVRGEFLWLKVIASASGGARASEFEVVSKWCIPLSYEQGNFSGSFVQPFVFQAGTHVEMDLSEHPLRHLLYSCAPNMRLTTVRQRSNFVSF